MNNQGICVNGIVLNANNEVLLVKRSLEDTAFPGNWELPGGGVEYGEIMEESLKRELQEEVGLSVEVLQPLTVNNFYIGKTQYFETTFLCKVVNGSNTVTLSHEHVEHRWVAFNKKDTLEISEYMRKTLQDSQKILAL